jgi:hypothetical protein
MDEKMIPIEKLEKFIKDYSGSKTKLSAELDLWTLSKLMNGVGFIAPVNKKGSARGFSHALLETEPTLVEGRFTVHVLHNRRPEKITYHDFKIYMLPFLRQVITMLKEKETETRENEHVGF